MSWNTNRNYSTIDEGEEYSKHDSLKIDSLGIEEGDDFTSVHLQATRPLDDIGTPVKNSRFHVKASKKTLEDFEFDEQFMIDAITEHYKKNKRNMILKKTIYNFLNYPKTLCACAHHIFTFCLCIITLVMSMSYNLDEFRLNTDIFIPYIVIESILMVIFTIELCLHVWCCDVKLRYKNGSRLAYLCTFYALIDMFTIATIISKIVIFYCFKANQLNKELILGLQLLQITKILHYERYNNTLKIMSAIIWRHRKEILSSYLIILYMIISVSFLIYLFEYKNINAKLQSLPDSFYFVVVSFATIGYGDIYPTTSAGKILISISAILGIALVALPSGIIGSGFALQLAYEEKKKRISNRKLPAVLLIQNAWRRYSIITKSRSSKYYKLLYLLLVTNSGSIINDKTNESTFPSHKKHGQSSNSHVKRTNVKIEEFNAADNSATITIQTGSKNIPLLTYIKIPDNIANTKVYKNVFRFLAEVNLNISLRNFKNSRKQDFTFDSLMNKLQRQNLDILHQLSILRENFDKAFFKFDKIPFRSTSVHKPFSKKRTVGKVESVVNLDNNINMLDSRLSRIEHLLKQLIETPSIKNDVT